MAKAYQDGSGWAFRLRVAGQDIYRGGFKTKSEAQEEANGLATDLKRSDKSALLGAQRTSVAQGLSDYAREVLPSHKGAPQEARRINRYLRALNLPVIHLEKFAGQAPVKHGLRKRKKEQAVHWTVTLSIKRRLAQLGLRVGILDGRWQLLVANHVELRKLFAGTKWAGGGWGLVLRRLLGGMESTQRLGAGLPCCKVTMFTLPDELQPPRDGRSAVV